VEHQGGVTSVVEQILDHWDANDPIVPRLIVDSWESPSLRETAGVLNFRFDLLGTLKPSTILKSLVRAPLTLYQTLSLLRRFNVVAVNFHYVGLSPLGIVVLRRLGLYRGRLILSFHGTDVRSPETPFQRRLISYILRSADAVVACSNGLATRMVPTLGITRDRISVIYNGVDVDVFRADPPKVDALVDRIPKRYLVSVGAYIPRKAHDVLLDAYSEIAKALPDLDLCIVGADGSVREAVIAQCAQLGLSSRVHLFVNLSRTAVAHLLARAELFVQTSRAEGLPLAVLEAGAVGVPIAVTRIPGHDELIFDGETGRLFDVDDARDCASVITAMLDDLDKARSMGAAFRRRVRSELTWDIYIEKIRALYEHDGHRD
jgi:glycosyltransferase involved in cell wall biosynthesis